MKRSRHKHGYYRDCKKFIKMINRLYPRYKCITDDYSNDAVYKIIRAFKESMKLMYESGYINAYVINKECIIMTGSDIPMYLVYKNIDCTTCASKFYVDCVYKSYFDKLYGYTPEYVTAIFTIVCMYCVVNK